MGGLDPNYSITFILDVDNNNTKDQKQNMIIQIQTQYKHPSGHIRYRVTTLSRQYFHDFRKEQILYGFDQEAVIAVFAKLGSNKSQELDGSVVIRWIDKNLIFLMSKFAIFKKGEGNEETFNMPDEISIIPQFFYYLRKGPFIKTFGLSLDENVNYRIIMARENVANILTMIQPCITRYDLESDQPTPVVCDIESMQNNIILLMDCYFFVAIWYGAQIKEWMDQEYHLQEDYAHLKAIIDLPEEHSRAI